MVASKSAIEIERKTRISAIDSELPARSEALAKTANETTSTGSKATVKRIDWIRAFIATALEMPIKLVILIGTFPAVKSLANFTDSS